MKRTDATEIQAPAIRPASEGDLAAINEIYNHYVIHSTCTYQEEPELLSGRQQWFAHHGTRHPVIVAQLGSAVVGWGSLSPYPYFADSTMVFKIFWLAENASG